METLHAWAGRVYFGNDLQSWAEAVGIFVLLLVVLPAVRVALARRLRSLRPHQSPTALELAIALYHRTTRPFIVAVAAYFALKTLSLPPRVDHVIDIAIQLAFWTQAALWGARTARFMVDRRMQRVAGDQLPTLAILQFVSLVLVWSLAVLMLLSNLGFNITTLVTSLGIGGVAVALAVQNVLGDVLASLAIAFDKPFQIGDELHLDDINGTVERIGIKSTHLRSIDGEQIIIANSQLLQAKLRNFGRAREQRTTCVLTLAFDTPTETLRAIPALVEQVVKSLPSARFGRCTLHGLGAAGFEFALSLFATEPAKLPVADLRAQFTLALLERLRDQRIGFASPGAPVLAQRPEPAAEPDPAAAAAVEHRIAIAGGR
ncbi:MAG TPA: mechanosensitive ion channel domain-containing protein [Steroidobacteraceae bacterium]